MTDIITRRRALAELGIANTPGNFAVHLVAVANINLSALPAQIDGVTPPVGSFFLAAGQTSAPQNGVYVYTGLGLAATRAPGWDTQDDFVAGKLVTPTHGDVYFDTLWILQATVAVLNTDDVTFEQETNLASGVSYDNTGSGLTATEVQGALDELAGMVGGGMNWAAPVDANITFDGAGTRSIGDATNYGADFFFRNWKSGIGQGMDVIADDYFGVTLGAGKVLFFETSDFQIYGKAGAAGAIGLWDGGGNNFLLKHQAPNGLAADFTYTWPVTAPITGQVLSSTNLGVLSWVTAGGITWATPVNSNIVPTGAPATYSLGNGTDFFDEVHAQSYQGPTGSSFTLESDAAITLYSNGGNDIQFISDANINLDCSANNGTVIAAGKALRLPSSAGAPASPTAGDMYFDTGTLKSYTYDGTTWQAHF